MYILQIVRSFCALPHPAGHLTRTAIARNPSPRHLARTVFCTDCKKALLCRLFLPFSRPISARISIFKFYAEKIVSFRIRILHEFDFSNFLQKKSCLSPPNFCKNPTFPFLCRKNHELPPSFSARFSLFHFRAENVAQSTQNCLHKSQISHFVQKPARNCGAVGGGGHGCGHGAGDGGATGA